MKNCVLIFVCFLALSFSRSALAQCGAGTFYVGTGGEVLDANSNPVPASIERCFYFHWRTRQHALQSAEDRATVQLILDFYRARFENENAEEGRIGNTTVTPVDSTGPTGPTDPTSKGKHAIDATKRGKAFEATPSQFDPYVRECLARRPSMVQAPWASYQEGPFGMTIPPRWFRVTEDAQPLIEITFVMYPTYVGCRSESERRQLHSRIKGLRDTCISEFFARHGVRFNGLFADELTPASSSAPGLGFNIHCSASSTTYNATNWVMANVDDDNACGTLTHELGHWLGLSDRYPDDRHPGRQIGPSDNIMHHCWCHPRNVRLHPSDMRTILGSFCG